ncbi:MAG: hypothetical protein QOH32_3132 [Bradyrhizobium sp.]|jgi:hypothetical protein|nr:hypothetical protein [Bradyrhizobium sp.]
MKKGVMAGLVPAIHVFAPVIPGCAPFGAQARNP